MATRRSLRLRTILAAVVVWIILLSATVVTVLVVLTSYLKQTTEGLSGAVESVRLGEEAELELLLFDRSDATDRRDIEGELRRRLLELEPFATPGPELELFHDAEARVEAYLVAAGSAETQVAKADEERTLSSLLEEARVSLDALVDINIEQARVARDQAARWNELAKVLGIGTGVLLLMTAGSLLWWLQVRVFRPVFELARVMEGFGRGDRAARAREGGPKELRDMTARFNEMATALAAQREAQMAFLGGVAHDLRTPLSALRMALATIPEAAALPPEERIRHTLRLATRQVVRFERMLGDLIDTAKIEAGHLELKMEPCDARTLVEDVFSLFAESSSGHRIELTFPPEEVRLRCDAMRIEQVLTNLVSNAIKYSPAGGVIGLTLDQPSRTERNEIVICVKDEGVGMSDEDCRHLFEPFRRVGVSRETVPGVGLGLFVVRQIVEAHGGHIDVESAPGRGSTFRVYLPVA